MDRGLEFKLRSKLKKTNSHLGEKWDLVIYFFSP
jgi:hypothetical protein